MVILGVSCGSDYKPSGFHPTRGSLPLSEDYRSSPTTLIITSSVLRYALVRIC